MILQAESKKEYEEVSFKSPPRSHVLEPGRVNTGELSGMICVVVIFGRVLGNICHSQCRSARQLASERTGALTCILFSFTVDLHRQQHLQTDLPD